MTLLSDMFVIAILICPFLLGAIIVLLGRIVHVLNRIEEEYIN